jgi:hypothetical protein
VAYAKSDGGWAIRSKSVGTFGIWATKNGVTPLAGDFNGDGRTDIALLNQGAGWGSVPVSFAKSDGSWTVLSKSVGNFGVWATRNGVTPLAGDFNGDGRSDIALLNQGTGWVGVPVAYAKP